MKKRGKTKIFLLAVIAAVIIAILAYAGFILFIRIPELMKNSGQPEFARVYGKMPWERLVTVQPYENITSATIMTPDNIFFPREMVIGKMEFSGTPSDTERIRLFNSIPLAPPYPVTATFNDNRTAVFDKDAWQINWHSGNFAYQLHAAITDNPARPDGINSLLRLFPFPAPEGKADFDCAISAEKLSGNASFAGSFGDESGRFSADSDITLDGQTFIFKSLHYKNSSGGVAIDFAPAAVTVKPNGEYQLSGKISAFALNTPTAKLSLTGEAEFSGVWRNGQLPEISFGGATLKDGSISGTLEQIKVEPDQLAKVVIDETSGIIVIGKDVKINRLAIAQGNLTIRITEVPFVSQPLPFSNGETVVGVNTAIDINEGVDSKLSVLETGVNLQELVNGLNALGVTPRDLISILQAIKASGALQADIEVI